MQLSAAVFLAALFTATVKADTLGLTQICRFVCPSNVGILMEESLGTDGSVGFCFWSGNGFGARWSSFNSTGDLIPFSESSNNQGITRAGVVCTTVTDGWTWAQGEVCIQDSTSSRILAGDTIVPIPNNSPEACTAACDAEGFTFAGVEFGSECHCGTGFSAAITTVPHDQCNMVCTGNSTETCGAGGLIEVFAGPNPPRAAQLPAGWSIFPDAPCAQDSAARMFTDTLIAGPLLAATDTPAACTSFCADQGYTLAGVEGGDECYCGTEFRQTPQALDQSACNLPCQGAIGTPCGGNFAIQLYQLE